MADDGHVFGAVAFSEAGLVVGEGDVEDPVQLVLDAQWPRTASAALSAERVTDEMKYRVSRRLRSAR